jgi:hypothetical protein
MLNLTVQFGVSSQPPSIGQSCCVCGNDDTVAQEGNVSLLPRVRWMGPLRGQAAWGHRDTILDRIYICIPCCRRLHLDPEVEYEAVLRPVAIERGANRCDFCSHGATHHGAWHYWVWVPALGDQYGDALQHLLIGCFDCVRALGLPTLDMPGLGYIAPALLDVGIPGFQYMFGRKEGATR